MLPRAATRLRFLTGAMKKKEEKHFCFIIFQFHTARLSFSPLQRFIRNVLFASGFDSWFIYPARANLKVRAWLLR